MEAGEEALSGSVLEASSPKSGVSCCRCARLCWLYIRFHRHHQRAALAARTTATLASAITMMPQIGIAVSGDVKLPITFSLDGTAWGGLVMVLVVLVLVLVVELVYLAKLVQE